MLFMTVFMSLLCVESLKFYFLLRCHTAPALFGWPSNFLQSNTQPTVGVSLHFTPLLFEQIQILAPFSGFFQVFMEKMQLNAQFNTRRLCK